MTAEQESTLLLEVADLRRGVERVERPEDSTLFKLLMRGSLILSGSYEKSNGDLSDFGMNDISNVGFYFSTGEGQLVVVATCAEQARAVLDKVFPR